MNKQKWILFFVALGLIAGTAGLLVGFKRHPRLGEPGVKAMPVPGKVAMQLTLPECVLNFTSTNVPEPELVSHYLPSDTSYVGRCYQSPDGEPPISATLILMGTDRTSIHNADFCLSGQGMTPGEKKVVDIPIAGKPPYQLPVSEWKVSGTFQQPDGRNVKVGGVYVFWFVAKDDQTPSHLQMMWRFATHLAATGELKRWAYVSYFTACDPGREDAAFARMEKLIAASVPEFQLPPAGH